MHFIGKHGEKRKPRIAIDMDGIWVNLIQHLLCLYNSEHGTFVTYDSAWEHRAVTNTDKFVGDMLDDYLARDNIFADLPLLDGFLEALPELQNLGTVWIASTPSRNPDSASDKIRHVLRHTPSIGRRKICLLKDKWLLDVDVFFDDWPSNIVDMRAARPGTWIGAISYPYNESVKDTLNLRAEGYRDTRAAWEKLVQGAQDFVSGNPFLDPNAERI